MRMLAKKCIQIFTIHNILHNLNKRSFLIYVLFTKKISQPYEFFKKQIIIINYFDLVFSTIIYIFIIQNFI